MAGEQANAVVPSYQSQDIGDVAAAGSFSESGGVFSVRGSGADIYRTADEFRYVWQPLTGDGQITTRVVSQTNTDYWAKAGLMLREQLTANSRHALVFVTPGAGAFMQYRTATGGTTGPSSGPIPGIAAPYWLRLVRQGNVVSGYVSVNGTSWAQRGSVTFSSLPNSVYIGLAVSSRNDGVLSTVAFDNVAASASPPPSVQPGVDVTPPTIPLGLRVSAAGTNQINLSWHASTDTGAGVAGYRIFRNGIRVAAVTSVTYSDAGLSANTLYTYTVSAYDAASPSNESAPSTAASATTLAASIFQGQDIGDVAAAGSFSESGGVFSVRGSGADIYRTADEFRYVWQPLTGDGQITTRVVSQTNTDYWAKAGLMLREQLTANSRHALVFVTPGAGAFMQYRTATGGTTGPSSGPIPGIAAPYWLRLVRQGNVVSGYVSVNGTSWAQRGSVTFSSLPNSVYIGLAVSSRNDGVLSTVVFDNVARAP
jgi:hypothetical protein